MRRKLVALAAAVAAAVLPAAPALGDEPTYTCRASVIRVENVPLIGVIEPIVANPQQNPCRSDSAP